MIDRLPVWFFLSLAMILMGLASLPLIRVFVGIDQSISLQFWTVVMLHIGGLMSGLTAMILMVKRLTPINNYTHSDPTDPRKALMYHASGLLLFTGIPLANFLVCYWLWTKHRDDSELMDQQGQEALNFQISVYLYLLLSLFMTIALVGLIAIALLLVLHMVVTVIAMIQVTRGRAFKYPANIPIIQGRS